MCVVLLLLLYIFLKAFHFLFFLQKDFCTFHWRRGLIVAVK